MGISSINVQITPGFFARGITIRPTVTFLTVEVFGFQPHEPLFAFVSPAWIEHIHCLLIKKTQDYNILQSQLQ